MAEPVSALPEANPQTTGKTEPVPWPYVAEPEPRATASPSVVPGEGFSQRVRHELERSYQKTADVISNAMDRSRRQLRYVSQERPLQLVIGIAVAAFLTGAALRIWRSNRD